MEFTQWAWVYTDGACSGNPGPGGWAYCACVFREDQSGLVFEGGGATPATTNNRMEMQAVIEALGALAERTLQHVPVTLMTDSSLLVKGITEWLPGWKRKKWIKADGNPVLNRDLWEELDRRLKAHSGRVEWRLIRGHAGLPGNERADRIAVAHSKGVELAMERDVPLLDSKMRSVFAGLPASELVSVSKASKAAKSSPPQRASGTPYYISFVSGKLERHTTWSDCERRVKGVSGARFRKVANADEERLALAGWKAK